MGRLAARDCGPRVTGVVRRVEVDDVVGEVRRGRFEGAGLDEAALDEAARQPVPGVNAVRPPSTGRTAPVTYAASSEAKKSTTDATSSGRA